MKSNTGRRRARLLSFAATGLALCMTGGYAQAQETDEADSEVVYVTGFRASLQSSANVKRRESSIVEVVTAEEIGRLPDNSIAESLARLPGLTAQRLFGRAQVISVRGLAPDFTTALLNGREQVSAGDNRGVEFDQYPSELLSSVVVYKTPDAGLVGQGLAGTADLRTVRPLAVGERVFAASARYEWNDIGALNEGTDDSGYRYTLSYIDQSADGHWGWAFGIASNSSPTQAERWEAWGYINTTANNFLTDSMGNPLPADLEIIGGAKPYVQSSTLERTGMFGTLEYSPSPNFHSTLDMFYSEFDEVQTLRGIEMPLGWGGNLQPGFTVDGSIVTDGVWQGVDSVVRNDVRSRNSTVKAIGWNMEFGLGDNWQLSTDLSYSEVKRDDLDLEIWAGTGRGAAGMRDTLSFTQQGGGNLLFSNGLIDYADPSTIFLTDPNGWGGADNNAGFTKQPQIDDQLTALRLSAEREFEDGFLSSIEFGVNLSEREKSHTSIEAFVSIVGSDTVAVPAEFLQAPTELGFLGLGQSLSFDPVALVNETNIFTLRPLRNNDILAKEWTVTENVTTIYAQGNIDSAWGSIPLTGNAGLQVVLTDQSSDGFTTIASGVADIHVEDDFTTILPSLNLAWEVADNHFIRLGLARTLARPRMDDMRASFAINYNTTQINSTDPNNSYWGGSGGNPRLRPWIANSFDLSYEHYFESAGYFAVAAFYKDLDTFIYRENVPFDFTGYPVQNVGDMPAINVGVANTPQNAEGGYVQGIEATLSLPGEVITSALEGFGFIINGSSTGSSIQIPGNEATALPGLSETVINTTIYYERAGFEARVSNRYRTDFLGEVTGFGAGRELRTVQGESVVDAQLGYRFQDGTPLEGLSILLQGNNLTDEPFGSYFAPNEALVHDWQRYGSTFLIGVNYRR